MADTIVFTDITPLLSQEGWYRLAGLPYDRGGAHGSPMVLTSVDYERGVITFTSRTLCPLAFSLAWCERVG